MGDRDQLHTEGMFVLEGIAVDVTRYQLLRCLASVRENQKASDLENKVSKRESKGFCM